MKNILIKVLIAMAIIGGIFALYLFTPLKGLITFETLQANLDSLFAFRDQNYLLMALIFIGIYALAVSFSLPVGLYLSIGGGFFFGGLMGGLFIVLGATLGAMALFFAVRGFLGESIQKRYGKQLERFNQAVEEGGVFYFFSIRLVVVFPFFLINLLAGLTKVKPWTYFLTTFFGIMPGTFAYAFFGASVSSLTDGSGFQLPWEILVALSLLALISFVLPTILRKFGVLGSRKTGDESSEAQSNQD